MKTTFFGNDNETFVVFHEGDVKEGSAYRIQSDETDKVEHDYNFDCTQYTELPAHLCLDLDISEALAMHQQFKTDSAKMYEIGG
jgi:hypothetical protein